ncbi:hypothetical protein JSQ81_11490 [Sporosarcina sp. Marseille-Q4063]|uniref:DUF6339 family protein n=1 Tax=Sporosarcina sp. Marseille-Q4063 TaxID=2810514 RepID=UPI001BAFF570|nr:DUF6339 family protein [Sporosarcina sp. Marseille-Q4063]QUW20484.1 hypothetical protein JSQ81_11490 [Sporosarcina sp. Marseille-Q4063]
MKLLEEATLQQLKAELENNITLYQHEQPFMVKRLSIIEYENLSSKLNLTPDSPSKYDAENIQIFHEKFRDIPIELASEESFWSYFSHVEFWEYMQIRWPLKNDTDTSSIRNRYFFGKDRPLFRHGIARLWWYGHLTYNPVLDDPYHYTKVAFKDQDRARLLIETVNISRNRVALFATLDVLLTLDNWTVEGKIEIIMGERENVIRPLMQFINSVGGVMIWDLLSPEEAEEKIMSFIHQLIQDNIIVFKKSQVLI